MTLPHPLPTHQHPSRTRALPLPSGYQVAPTLPTFRGGRCPALPPRLSLQRRLGRGTGGTARQCTARNGTPAAHLAAAPGQLRGARFARSGTKREPSPPLPAPGGSAASPPAPARPSPAQVACGIAEPQLGRLPSPRTERRGSWRHVNDVLSYFH